MSEELLKELELSIRRRNSALADRLQPGLPKERIRQMLQQKKIQGAIEPLIELFHWKNGTRRDPKTTLEKSSPFPDSIYAFMDLEMMIQDFLGFKEFGTYHPHYTEVVDRYFPIFWDGSTGYLALDLDPSANNRVVLLDPESEGFATEAYPSFEDFVKDTVRANGENEKLACFQ